MRKKFYSGQPHVPILNDGAISNPDLAGGRMVPVLILDTTGRLDIQDLINAHENKRPGDAASIWGKKLNSKTKIFLHLTFERPVKSEISLEFDIREKGAVINLIVESEALILQAGTKGDRVSSTLDSPSIIVEVPKSEFGEAWKGIWLKSLVKKFRKTGLKRSEARTAATNMIDEIDKMVRKFSRRK